MYDKEIWVEFSEDAEKDYQELQNQILKEKERGLKNSTKMQLLKSIERAKNNLKIDPHQGIHIPRRNVSKTTAVRYGTDQLWKIDLVGY